MNKFVNHYETLNVSNDASLESIRASYHTLCKAFHPDLNPNMQDGLLMIEELTNSYEVLKDANSRQDYDLKYLIEMRRKSTRTVAPAASIPEVIKLPELPVVNEVKVIARDDARDQLLEFKLREYSAQSKSSSSSSLKVARLAALAIIGIALLGLASTSKIASRIKIFDLDQFSSKSSYVRLATAPNGVAFPETSSYLAGYQVGKNEGSTSLVVNNAKNDNDVYLKLISVEENKNATVRHVFVKAKTEFTLENLSLGKYEIQYLDLVAGLAGKSEVFSVNEAKTELGMKSTTLTVNLKTAINGILKVQNISVEEFNSLASL